MPVRAAGIPTPAQMSKPCGLRWRRPYTPSRSRTCVPSRPPVEHERLMENPAAVRRGGWIHRIVAQGGLTLAALTAHLAVLLAFAWASTDRAIIGEPMAAISVEIVTAIPGHAMTSMQPQDTSDDQDSSGAIAAQGSTPAAPPDEASSALAASAAPMRTFAPVPVPKRPPPVSSKGGPTSNVRCSA